MSLSLFSRVPWLNRRMDKSTVLGLAISGQKVYAVCLKRTAQEWTIHKFHSEKIAENSDLSTNIITCIEQVCNTICAVNIVIPHYFYHVVQMEKPALSDDEIALSLPWLVKDLVDINAENIVADFIDSPITLPMQNRKMNVFAANKELLIPLVSAFKKSKARIRTITSEEIALLSLFGKDKDAHMLVVQHQAHEPKILIIRNGQLLLVRRLNGFLGMGENNPDQALIEALGLEIQRSMDFFESQLKQLPIRSIQLHCDELNSLTIRAGLAEFLQIKVLQFTPSLPLAKSIDANYFNALAAAYELTQERLA